MTPPTRASKYLITQWEDEFDLDGLTNDFAILGEFDSFEEANAHLKPLAEQQMAKKLAQNSGWFPIGIGQKDSPQWSRVNKNRTVLARESFKAGDGTGFCHVYAYLEVIELGPDEQVSEDAFNMEDCEWELKYYFDARRAMDKGKTPNPES